MRHGLTLMLFLAGTWAIAQTGQASSLLWKIEGPGTQTSYLFGTIHLLPESEFKIQEKVTNAFHAAEQIVLEVDMDDPSLQMKLMQYATMKEGVTLEQVFSEEDYELVNDEIIRIMGIGLANLNTMKPYMLYSMLIRNIIEGTPASYELTFVQMAREKGLEVLGLETIAEQMAVFDRIPYSVQAEDVVDMVREKEEMKKEFAEMVSAYNAEDLEALIEITEEYADSEEMLNELIYKRNKNWIPLIREMSAGKRTFFGVGAGHLGGPEGVIALLKKAGYEVTPVD